MRPARPALPRLMPGPLANAAGTALMPALALASIAMILFTLRPGQPPAEDGPLVPGLQVQAGDTGALDPQPCDAGASPSLTAGDALLPVAGRYAAFLFDVDEPACFVLTANTLFSPPGPERVTRLADFAPIRLRPLTSLREGVEYFSVYAGYPSDQLQSRGFPPDRRLALVTAMSEVPDYNAAVDAVEYLASLALVPEPPPPPAPVEDAGDAPSLEPPGDG
jgi:hypothetical protein